MVDDDRNAARAALRPLKRLEPTELQAIVKVATADVFRAQLQAPLDTLADCAEFEIAARDQPPPVLPDDFLALTPEMHAKCAAVLGVLAENRASLLAFATSLGEQRVEVLPYEGISTIVLEIIAAADVGF